MVRSFLFLVWNLDFVHDCTNCIWYGNWHKNINTWNGIFQWDHNSKIFCPKILHKLWFLPFVFLSFWCNLQQQTIWHDYHKTQFFQCCQKRYQSPHMDIHTHLYTQNTCLREKKYVKLMISIRLKLFYHWQNLLESLATLQNA